MPESPLERTMAAQIRAARLPTPEREHRFHPTRRWQFDFAYPDRTPPIAVEVEGGTFARRSRHTSPTGFRADCDKYNEAAMMGWVVLRVTSDMVADGTAVRLLRQALAAPTNEGGEQR